MAMNNRRYRPTSIKGSTAEARERGRRRALHEEKPTIPGIAWFLIIVAVITVIALFCISERNEEMESNLAATQKRNAEIAQKNAETARKAQEDRERRKREKEEKMAAMRTAAEQQPTATQQPEPQSSTPAYFETTPQKPDTAAAQ